MAQIDIEILTPFAARFMEGTTLTPAEYTPVAGSSLAPAG